jgi:hypothetical protein
LEDLKKKWEAQSQWVDKLKVAGDARPGGKKSAGTDAVREPRVWARLEGLVKSITACPQLFEVRQ